MGERGDTGMGEREREECEREDTGMGERETQEWEGERVTIQECVRERQE